MTRRPFGNTSTHTQATPVYITGHAQVTPSLPTFELRPIVQHRGRKNCIRAATTLPERGPREISEPFIPVLVLPQLGGEHPVAPMQRRVVDVEVHGLQLLQVERGTVGSSTCFAAAGSPSCRRTCKQVNGGTQVTGYYGYFSRFFPRFLFYYTIDA